MEQSFWQNNRNSCPDESGPTNRFGKMAKNKIIYQEETEDE